MLCYKVQLSCHIYAHSHAHFLIFEEYKMFNFKEKLVYLLCVGLSLIVLSFSSFVHADNHDDDDEEGVSAELELFFSNKYVEEGIIEVPGRAVFIPELEVEFEGLEIGDFEVPSFFIGAELVILELGESGSFRESELTIGKEWNWNDYSMTLGYTWVYENEGDEEDVMPVGMPAGMDEEEEPNDHEFFLSLSCDACLPFEINPDLSYTYSTEADGGMVEVELAREIEMERFSIEPYVGTLIDFGYVTDEYNGLNNILVGLAVTVPLTDSISLGAYATHSFAEENLRRERNNPDAEGEYDDQTWAGIGLEFEL